MGARLLLRLSIYTLIIFAFCLGMPQFHYATAIMIALLVRHKHNPGALLQPIEVSSVVLTPRRSSSSV